MKSCIKTGLQKLHLLEPRGSVGREVGATFLTLPPHQTSQLQQNRSRFQLPLGKLPKTLPCYTAMHRQAINQYSPHLGAKRFPTRLQFKIASTFNDPLPASRFRYRGRPRPAQLTGCKCCFAAGRGAGRKILLDRP